MRLLITGITGFVGSHLAEYALTQGAVVVGSRRWCSPTEHVEHLRDRLSLVPTDLRDASATRALVAAARPDAVVHLAAQSFVAASWVAPAETIATNTLCQINLLEALRELSPAAPVVVAGYWLLLERGTPGEIYNLCSGRDWSMEQVLHLLLGHARVAGIEVRVDPARLRPSDVPVLRGSAEKIAKATGWRTRIPFVETLAELLEYGRQRLPARSR